MRVKDLKITDVIAMPEFKNEMQRTLDKIQEIHSKRKKSSALMRLVDKNVFDTRNMTILYEQVLNKLATGYSASERAYIKLIGNYVFHNVMKELIEHEKAENPTGRAN